MARVLTMVLMERVLCAACEWHKNPSQANLDAFLAAGAAFAQREQEAEELIQQARRDAGHMNRPAHVYRIDQFTGDAA